MAFSNFSITNLEQDIESALHGTTLNQIGNILGVINRASRKFLRDLDPQETKREALIGPVFNGIYDYPFPNDDVKGNKVFDIAPQVNRFSIDRWGQQYSQEFDITKQFSLVDSFTPVFNTGNKSVRINSPTLLPPITVNQIEAVVANGTWSAFGTASTLSTDNQNYAAGAGSVAFNLAAGVGSQTGGIVNTTMSQIDLTAHLNQGSEFLWVYLPTGSSFTSIELRWGSSSTAYYAVSVTTATQGNPFIDGWNLLQFDWLGASVTGSPTVSAIDYVRIAYTYDGTAQTGVHANGYTSNLGLLLQMKYYSKFLFRDAVTGDWKELTTDESDLINLDIESYDIFFDYVMYLICNQVSGSEALINDGPMYLNLYNDGVARYKALYKSEVNKPQSTYYRLPGNSYRRWWGTGYNKP